MVADEFDEELLAHLVVEFLDYGERAVEFLRTAKQLLTLSSDPMPQHAALVGYCLREALKAIPESQSSGASPWRERSRDVVDAKRRLELVEGLPGGERDVALRELLTKIDEMALTHEQDRIHQQRLIAVIVNRTGASPLRTGTDPVRSYQELIDRCDSAVHGTFTMDQARELWADCMAVLRLLFMPPDVRHRELDALAELREPGRTEAEAVLALLAGPNHLQRFLSRIQTVDWFDLLRESCVLDPPTGQGAWPVFAAVECLKDSDPSGLATALSAMLDRLGANVQQAWYIARAAIDLGSDGLPIVLRALQGHPASPGIAHLAMWAAEGADPAEEFVELVADIVLNSRPDEQTHRGTLLESMAGGTTPENCTRRIRLLCYKLRAVPADDFGRRVLIRDRGGSIGDRLAHLQDEHFAVLLQGLVQCLTKALDLVDPDALLTAIEPLPNDMAERVRAWVLTQSLNVDQVALVQEVSDAIATRRPTGDDARLVERVVSTVEPSAYLEDWRRQVPDPPPAGDLGSALAAGAVPMEWLHVLDWSGILPGDVTADWAAALAVLSARYGEPASATLERRMSAEFSSGRSPLSEEDIRALTVDEAARWIASWRPDPTEWLVSARELGRTLEAVVKANPTAWAREPVKTAGLLQHPTYIAHYLLGLAAADELRGAPLDQMFEVFELIRTHPWPAVRLGSDSFDFDPDWRGAELASVELIRSLARSNTGFGTSEDQAWSILQAEVNQRGEPSGIIEGARDPLDSAINRQCTRALETVLAFIGYESRTDRGVRPAALRLLTSTLDLAGEDGAQHRAILAPRIGFLRHVAPDWVEQHRERLFGDAAPEELGQLTVDLALKWGQPNSWLLEQFQPQVWDAVRREVENALDHCLVAMLHGDSGYAVPDLVRFLSTVNQLSSAGERLGRLLRANDSPKPMVDLATEFWNQALELEGSVDLAGFGWFSEITNLDDAVWADLTLRTLLKNPPPRIDWAHKIAQRCAAMPCTTTVLSILNELVRGLGNEWDVRRAGETAVTVLQQALQLSDTLEYQRLRTTLLERGLM